MQGSEGSRIGQEKIGRDVGSGKVWSQMEMAAMNFRADGKSLMEMHLVEMNLSFLCPEALYQPLTVSCWGGVLLPREL